MNFESLFAIALGITPPCGVEGIFFSIEDKCLDINIGFSRGYTFACPVYRAASPACDTKEKTWRHLNFLQYEAYLTARVPRVKCPDADCGVKRVSAPWVRSGSGFKLSFEALEMTLVREMPVKVAKTVRNHLNGILAWFDSKLSNGFIEAINGLIQSAKRRARGYRSTKNLINMAYLIAGKLDFKLIT